MQQLSRLILRGNDTPPIAENDFAQVDPGGTVVVTVLDNDTDDVGLDASSVVLVGLPQNGTATVNATGTIDYTHGNVNPGDEFTYTVLDTLGQVSNEATVQISTLPSGLVAHYESNALVTQSGGLISSWGDLSGEGNDLTASGDVQLLPSALNGRPVLDFDGVGDALVRDAGFNGLPVGAQDRSVYMVVNYEGTGSGGFAYGQFASNRTFGLHVESAGLLRVNGHGPNHDYTSDTVGTGAGWLVQSVVLSGNSAVHAVDGVPIDTYTQTYNTTLDKIVLGADLDEDPYVDMQVATILVFDRALTAAEQGDVMNQLFSRYGLPAGPADLDPVAVADAGTTVDTGAAVVIDVLANDTDDGNALDASTVTVITAAGSGTTSVDAVTGVITYTHDGSAGTADTFEYTVQDAAGNESNPGLVSITIDDDADPVAVADSGAVDTGAAVIVDVLLNDTDDGNALDASTVTVVTAAGSGTTSVDAVTGVITYTHDGSAGTADTFEYTVQDAAGNESNPGLVSISINDDADPVAVADSGAADTGAAVIVDVLLNDTDDGNALDASTVTVVTAAGSGTTSVDAVTGVITYTHDGSAGTADTFEYTVQDAAGNESNPGLVSISVSDDADPVAVADSGAVDTGAAVIVDVLLNDTDDGNALDASTVTVVTAAGSGTTNVDAVTGVITYTHDGSAGTADTFEYTVQDAAGNESNPGLVSITIDDDADPVAVADSGAVDTGAAVIVDVLLNDTDDGNALDASTVTVVTAAGSGTTSVDAVTGVITYTHDGSAGTADTFEYTVQDAAGNESNPGLVSISINDDANPVAVADSGAADTGAAVIVDVLLNDTDDGNALDASTVTVVTAAGSGTTSVDAVTGAITYTHDGSAGTADTFEYTVQDAAGNESNPGLVSISVNDDANPVAVADSGTADTGAAVVVDVLANDTDDGNALDASTVTVVTTAGSGTTSVDAITGAITYTHDGSAGTADTFEYTVEDAAGNESNPGLVSITINDDADPVAVADSGTVDTGAVVVIDVLANDTDDGNALDASTVTVVTAAGSGITSVDAVTGEITYTHDGSAGTEDTFEYTVEDAAGNESNPGLVSITINDDADPEAVADSGTVDTGAAVVIDVLANDTDDGNALDASTVTVVIAAGSGTTSVDAVTGEITYTHDGSAGTEDTFLYTVQDAAGNESSPGLVTITISEDANPVAVADSGTVDTGAVVVVDVLANDTDDGNALDASTVTVVTAASFGTTSVDAITGEITYTHDGSVGTSDSFEYTVEDSSGNISDFGLVSLAISEVFSLPTAGLVAHFDAGIGVTETAGNVTAWEDQSSQFNDLNGFGNIAQIPNALNGNSVMSFDGSSSYFALSNPTGFPIGGANRSVFYVVEYVASNSAGISYGQNVDNASFGLNADIGLGTLTVDATGPSNQFVTNFAGNGAGWILHGVVLDNDEFNHILDETSVDTQSHVFNSSANEFVIGIDIGQTTFSEMQLAEIVIYDRALSYAEQQQVAGHMRDKYDLDNN